MAKKRKKGKPFDPAKDTGEKRPVRAVVALGDINDKYSTYPSAGLSPGRLARIFKEADQGDVMSQMELFEEIEEKDPHIFSQLQTRKLAVTGLDWTIQPAGDSEKDKLVADMVEGWLRKVPRFNEVMLDILDAVGKGISISEIEWGISRDGYDVITGIEWVHPKKLMWDYETDELKICTAEYPEGISLPENKFVLHHYKAKSGHPSRAGILRVVAWMYLFKNYDLKDWVTFCEVFGMPLRLGKYNAAASDADKRDLQNAIINLGTDAAGIIPDTADIDFIESNKTSSAEIYENLARYCDEQISKAVLGQTLTSDSGGSYAQGKVHADVRHDLTVADAVSLDETIDEYIIRPLVWFNFGADTECPHIQHDCKDPEDLKETAEIYKTLSADMGVRIPEKHIYKKFAIPEPEDDERCIDPFGRNLSGAGQLMQPETKSFSLSVPFPAMQEAEQREIDNMADQAVRYSADIFKQMIRPVLKIVDEETDITSLKERLNDGEELRALYEEMNSQELEDLLAQASYLAALIGRSSP